MAASSLRLTALRTRNVANVELVQIPSIAAPDHHTSCINVNKYHCCCSQCHYLGETGRWLPIICKLELHLAGRCCLHFSHILGAGYCAIFKLVYDVNQLQISTDIRPKTWRLSSVHRVSTVTYLPSHAASTETVIPTTDSVSAPLAGEVLTASLPVSLFG